MGDPAGIGPEIIAQAFCERPGLMRQVVVAGDVTTLRRAMWWAAGSSLQSVPPLMWAELSELRDFSQVPPGCVAIIQACSLKQPVELGRISADAGEAAADCIRFAAQAALSGQARAVVTAPIHKEALAAAGVTFPGHTEMLQSLAATHQGIDVAELPVRMMLSCPGLRTVLVSIHVSLQQALNAVSKAQVLQTLRITQAYFQLCGMAHPRIAVAGLNPHAGEGGLFGREEIEEIVPAVAQAVAEGIDCTGPHAPDTVFMRARQGAFDVVVAMYHDQGLIPVKLLGLEHGVNTTLGLPFVRTSPDHGTAFDLAGTGRASAASLLAALDAAISTSKCL
ncbi:MAG: 4-hydroxythreonine-4-phosphate dehydrogenase PdxA [Hydrogenophaga sp.]|uniref:4-hydroxythreonine-4-phosphate dehydrogenase PdxA n=1 Tax=Hydrogenophaga sp. TaxID=1904254 RepID=UPI002764DBEA|nr:4-hydroxythreonine-4-phosphate dehydrogenase PdxA [Hydrogenophaga sp.]MDP2417458.1 4-hydroxythreonine-4-phosphate dehydrogenase PdxA [Hydrogenophaga sp.]MDZ4189679.1 4-hydroxythreonine-4-phosphate dehydrogenase PdxA [Hydrogenophaga sp.]